MEDQETAVGTETQQKYWEVDVKNVKPLNRAGGNIRVDYGEKDGSFQELVDSIRENGVLVPIRGYRDKENDGQWIAIDGHRRLTAAMKLVEEEKLDIRIRVVVVDARKVSDEQIIYEMVTTNSGKALSPIEMAEAVRRLQAYGHSTKDIAKKFGKTYDFVNNLSLFASAPKRLRDHVAANKVSYSLVLDVLRETKDFNEAIEKIEKALDIAKSQVKQKMSIDPDTDTSEPLQYKATKQHLDLATNKVDSMKELQMVIREIEEQKLDVSNKELFNFATAIAKNRITASDIKKELL